MSDEMMNQEYCKMLPPDEWIRKTECLMCGEKLRQESDIFFRECMESEVEFGCRNCGHSWTMEFEELDKNGDYL